MEKIFLVIPTIRNLENLKEWGDEFKDIHLIIVEDNPKKQISIPKIKCLSIYHYCHEDIDKDLGEKSWIIPRKSAAIRSYGFYKAYQLGADIVITIDDDVYPEEKNFVQKHLNNLSLKAPNNWFPIYPVFNYWYTRGFPYKIRNKRSVVLSLGLWSNILDLDAPTQLLNLDLKIPPGMSFVQFIPDRVYFPMCIMNLAFKREVIPLTYLLLMGHDKNGECFGYERFDDIWAGVIFKKICDHLGFATVFGSPFVEHRKASDPFANLEKEAKGIKTNEDFWQRVDKVKLTKNNLIDCYKELIKKINFPKEKYFILLKKAMCEWISLFKNH